MNDTDMEKEITQLGLIAPRVTVEDIDSIMAGVTYKINIVEGTTTTLATAIMDNGFTLAIGMSACASPENFNKELGEKYAKLDAEKKARDAVWQFEGYHLKRTLENN